MPRAAKPLLERCRERSFRPRHHWRLLGSEPNVPWGSLAELQQQAREVEDETELRRLARVFKRRLDALTDEELQFDASARTADADAAGNEPQASASAKDVPVRDATLVDAVEETLAEITHSTNTQPSAREAVEAELIKRTAERLADIQRRLGEDGITVAGSKRQLRPHPLLPFEAGLRRELIDQLRQFEFRVTNRATHERIKNLTRAPVRPAPRPAPRRSGSNPRVTAVTGNEAKELTDFFASFLHDGIRHRPGRRSRTK
jgi:hypothetical protein